ncbi:hypothetical protein M501DRAFT_1018827 [Patellaria atrata CBS 101060]|uniref:C3H1-type domain-containing protein n=1 Tax=Patellaria atrata CBS 101060 TaxID=1346257 RepID=A0A9P4VMB4_9PEZI|nr:hypothetical protein M501DRAFT_1018827 [Patellaria atrata CBS 101060]
MSAPFRFPPPPPPPPTLAAPQREFDSASPHKISFSDHGNRGGRGTGQGYRGRGSHRSNGHIGRGTNRFNRGRGNYSQQSQPYPRESHGQNQSSASYAPYNINSHSQSTQHPPSHIPYAPNPQTQPTLSNAPYTSTPSPSPYVQTLPNGSHTQYQPFAPNSSFSNGAHISGPAPFLQAQKNNRSNPPKPPVAPAVPSFGFTLPQVPTPGRPSTTSNRNQLGLVPSYSDDQDEEIEHDANGEANAGIVEGPSKSLVVEYRGSMVVLDTAEKLSAWIAERRNRFPTAAKQAEVAKKKAEMQASRKTESRPRTFEKKNRGGLSEVQKITKPVGGLDARSIVSSSSELSDSSELTESDSDASSEDEDEDEDSDVASTTSESSDSAPEEVSSNSKPPPVRVEAPKRNEPTQSKKVCMSFARKGSCKFGKRCKYLHERKEKLKGQASNRPSKRARLYERFVEKELEDEDKLVLEVIKFLSGENLLT